MSRQSLASYIEEFTRHGAQVAVAHRRGYRMARRSYRQLVEGAREFARELDARQVGRGERVLLWGENCAEWVVAFLGCALRGAVVVPMDPIATSEFASGVARQVNARLAICGREQPRGELGVPSLEFEALPEILARHSPAPYPLPDLNREDQLEIVFTSGTTAEPRGVVITHGNVLANLEPLQTEIRGYLKYERLVHPLRFLNLLPLSHVFGQFLGIFVPPVLAATVIFQDTLNPSEVIRTIRSERVSVLVAVPRMLETLRDKIERDWETTGKLEDYQMEFKACEGEHFLKRWWRFRRIHRQFGWKFWAFISGGAALPTDVEAFWSRLGFAVIQGYGLTETTSLISVNHPFQLARGSIGKALPGREIKLAENGEILVRSESVAAGYWQPSALAPAVGEEGWFHTGDLGTLDEQGNLYFKGRRKNVIVTPAGMNVYPEDLEAALRRQPEVRDAVVIGFERDRNAEPCAVLLLRDAASDAGTIIQRANQSLAEYQQIRRWSVWPDEDFPRTPTQKPQLHIIEQTVRERLAAPTAGPPATSELARLIERITGRPPARLAPDARLSADLQLSSIDRVELLGALEDRYQIDLSEGAFTAAMTVADLERMLHRPAAAAREQIYPRWAQRWPVTWIRFLVYYLLTWPATLLLGYPRVRGRENLRGVRGPVLVISNHITAIDIGFLLAALPLRLRQRLAVAMEAEILWAMRYPPADFSFLRRGYERLGYVLAVALFNVFPLPQQSGFRESFKFAGESVDRGYSVLVFPEGARTRDGKMAPFQTGIGLLANGLGLPIVPMRIDGLFELKQAKKWATLPGAVKVTIGPRVRFERDADPLWVARELQRLVATLR